MSDTPSPAAAEDTQRVEQLSRCFATLDKVVRGMRLYEGRGALIERLMADLELKLSTMLEQGEVTVRVTPIGLVYGTSPLTAAGEKTPRYLFRLFCDGVRELTFLPGVERSEIVDLVAVLNMEAQGEDEDLVTLLWKKQMRHIQYFAADTLDMTTQVSADGELSLAYEASESRLRQSGAGAGGQEVHLSADDLRVLRQDERLAWVKDCTAPTRAEGALAEAATRIKQAFVSPKDYPRFLAVALRHSADGAEASPLVLNMIDAQLRQGDLDTVAPVLEAIIEAAEEGSDPAQALKKRLCDADRMALIAPVYADNTERLAPILQSLAKADNQAIVTLLEHLDSPEAKAALQDVLNQAQVDLTPFYEGHLRSEDEKQIVAGIEALGRIGTPPAIKAVVTSLGHTLSSVRHAALLALRERYQPESRISIGRVLKDPSPDNRMLAIDLLASSGDSRVAWLLLSAIQEPAFLQKGASEQEALFTALASFKDARTLDFFKGVLQSGGLLKNKALVERQLQAARALAQMSTPEATIALQDCRGKWGLAKPVKAEINRLLAGARP
jgi:hypothetical protein